jgi:hypothetical protein
MEVSVIVVGMRFAQKYVIGCRKLAGILSSSGGAAA